MSFDFKTIKATQEAALVLFTSQTCGPCKRLKPRLQALAEQYGFAYYPLDINDEMPAVRELGLRAVPTAVTVKSGSVSVLFTGELHDDAIVRKLQEAGLIAA